MPSAVDRDWSSLRESFLQKVEARSGSMKSRLEYDAHLRRFFARCPDPITVTVGDCQAYGYGVGPRGRPPAASTIQMRLAVISSWYAFLIRLEILERNPAARVERPRRRRARPRSLSADEVELLVAALPGTPEGLMHRAAIETALYTGLRKSAVLALCSRDLRFEAGSWIYRVREKGGDVVEGDFPAPAMEALARACIANGRPLDRLRPADRLFPMTGNRYWRIVGRYAERAGLGHLAPHALRHSACRLQREAGMEIEEVAAFAHHASIATTSIYLSALVPKRANRWREVAALRRRKAG